MMPRPDPFRHNTLPVIVESNDPYRSCSFCGHIRRLGEGRFGCPRAHAAALDAGLPVMAVAYRRGRPLLQVDVSAGIACAHDYELMDFGRMAGEYGLEEARAARGIDPGVDPYAEAPGA